MLCIRDQYIFKRYLRVKVLCIANQHIFGLQKFEGASRGIQGSLAPANFEPCYLPYLNLLADCEESDLLIWGKRFPMLRFNLTNWCLGFHLNSGSVVLMEMARKNNWTIWLREDDMDHFVELVQIYILLLSLYLNNQNIYICCQPWEIELKKICSSFGTQFLNPGWNPTLYCLRII